MVGSLLSRISEGVRIVGRSLESGSLILPYTDWTSGKSGDAFESLFDRICDDKAYSQSCQDKLGNNL